MKLVSFFIKQNQFRLLQSRIYCSQRNQFIAQPYIRSFLNGKKILPKENLLIALIINQRQ
jgi:hypothetical protein